MSILKPFDLRKMMRNLAPVIQSRPGFYLKFENVEKPFYIDKFSIDTFPQMIEDSGFTPFEDEKGKLWLIDASMDSDDGKIIH